MDFRYTPEQQTLADSVAKFTARDYTFDKRRALIDDPARHWPTLAELGWLGAGLPEEGGGPVETTIVMEAFGRALVIEPYVAVAVLTAQTLAAVSASNARDELLAAIVSGDTKVALAHGEAAARGDVAHVETTIENGAIYGKKTLVLAAPQVEKLLVSARNGAGVGLYLVDPRGPGVAMTPYRLLDNQRAADIAFTGAPVRHTLQENASAAIATGYAHALSAIAAEAVGAMETAIGITRNYLKTRQQFGVTLNTFQALQHRMADMLVETEMSRSMLYQGLAAFALEPARRDNAISAMKAVISHAALFVGRNAIQLHGGIGMTEEYSIGHYYRRLFVIASQFGNEDFHLAKFATTRAVFWPEINLQAQS